MNIPDIPALSDWNFKDKRETAWTTENEKDFIDRLGRHGLAMYLQTINKRSDWGAMDQLAVRMHLAAALKRRG